MTATAQLDRYRYLAPLGMGGMATVVLAEDTVLGRKVALKQLNLPGDARGLMRLRREALIGASVSHPNLVSIYDVVQNDAGEQVIVMEYVAGETLRDLLRREGALPHAKTLEILAGVSAALDAIHGQNIVHRDVKPANVLLGEDGSIKLADLGIAASGDRTRITTDGAILGTFSYMAPEQLDGRAVTPAADVYALAAMAFEMLSGRKARTAPNPMALAHEIATEPPPDIRRAWPQAPAALAVLLATAMARDPRQRPRGAGELVGRVRAAVAPEATVAMRPPVARVPLAPPPVAPPPVAPAPVAPPPAVAARREDTVADRAAANPIAFSRPADRNRTRLALLIAAGMVAIVVAVVLAATLPGQKSSSSARGSTRAASTRSAVHRHRTHHSASTGASTGTSAGVGSVGTAASGSPAGSTSATTSGTAATSGTPASGVQASGTTGSGTTGAGAQASTGGSGADASTPVAAVESFYHLAAAHDYSSAWALADPSMQSQLDGYGAFSNQFSHVRSVTFQSAATTQQTSSRATVTVRTTSVQDSGTQTCSGPVTLVQSGGGWLLDHIAINCS